MLERVLLLFMDASRDPSGETSMACTAHLVLCVGRHHRCACGLFLHLMPIGLAASKAPGATRPRRRHCLLALCPQRSQTVGRPFRRHRKRACVFDVCVQGVFDVCVQGIKPCTARFLQHPSSCTACFLQHPSFSCPRGAEEKPQERHHRRHQQRDEKRAHACNDTRHHASCFT